MKSSRLAGDVAVVTGAASGLDRGIAHELAAHGAVVACADLDLDGARTVADEIVVAGGEAFAVRMDVASTESVRQAFADVHDRTGRITILVNGAAVAKKSQIDQCTDDEWDFVMNINLTGPFRCLREAHPHFVRSGGGRVVNISSTSGRSGGNWAGPHYVASKAGLIGLTKYAAGYWVKDGIRVNAICPGVAETPLTAADADERTTTKEQQVANVPMKRFCLPSDVAGAVMFLVSDESEYVTGITVDVTGGRYMYNN
jgi:NAD(P)-dependent dehydrogenase (short-subunit alcohol dehydrogenase family)